MCSVTLIRLLDDTELTILRLSVQEGIVLLFIYSSWNDPKDETSCKQIVYNTYNTTQTFQEQIQTDCEKLQRILVNNQIFI